MKRVLLAVLMLVCLALPSLGARAHAEGSLTDVMTALPLIRGEPSHVETLDGRVVLVAFFASWCPPCKHEFPHLNAIQDAFVDDGLQVVAVNVFETFDGLSTPAKLEAFLDDVAPVFPVLKGNDDTRRVFGNLDRIPTMFVFGRDGAPAYVFRHERNAEKTHLTERELREVIEPLL